ncbi:hypothetical protein MNV49_000802 [Pseudohyphozyma bogoriensis]|nr:hypothetical protein MNV49_000802 [Pseudohyphozyma bogoriensis]
MTGFLELPQHSIRVYYASVNSLEFTEQQPASHALDPNKPTIVFFHSALSSSRFISPQFDDPRLAGAYNLVSFDIYLHGRTTGEDRDHLTLREMATYMDSAIKKLGLESYSIIGENYLGATIACHLAIWNPSQVSANTGTGIAMLAERIVNLMDRDPIPAELLAKITCPTMLLQGGDDKHNSPVAAVEEWRKMLPSCKGGVVVREIASAPHVLLYTDSSIANRFILQFLSTALGTSNRTSQYG